MKKQYIFFILVFLFSFFRFESSHAQYQQRINAWVSAEDDVFLLGSFERLYPTIALLRYGDRVIVTECRPNCQDRNALVQLYPFGVIRNIHLNYGPVPDRASYYGDPARFMWAKVKTRNAVTTLTPNRDSVVISRLHRNDEIALRQTNINSEFFQRLDGSYIHRSQIELFSASNFSGWENPPQKFIFINRDTVAVNIMNNQQIQLHRFERFEYMRRDNNFVYLANSLKINKRDVRFGERIARPNDIPDNVRWVHVDLDEQILTAYDRNDDMVFATLVSTGRGSHRTRPGTFQIRRKTTHTHMRGPGYSVEGITYVQYLDGVNENTALHTAFWHNNFGNVRSHGCINLSPADAEYLYNFSPMEVPQGWRSIHPIALGIENLWVVIE